MKTSKGVVTCASGSTNTSGFSAIQASSEASLETIEGCSTEKRERKVAAPRSVPAPKWLNTWRRPSAATTVCPAWAPPLKRITAASGSPATTVSTTRPLPSSPKLAPITTVALRGFMAVTFCNSATRPSEWVADRGSARSDEAGSLAGPAAVDRQAGDGAPDDEAGRAGPGLRDGVTIVAGCHLGGRNDDFRHPGVIGQRQGPLSDEIGPCRADAVRVGLHV